MSSCRRTFHGISATLEERDFTCRDKIPSTSHFDRHVSTAQFGSIAPASAEDPDLSRGAAGNSKPKVLLGGNLMSFLSNALPRPLFFNRDFASGCQGFRRNRPKLPGTKFAITVLCGCSNIDTLIVA